MNRTLADTQGADGPLRALRNRRLKPAWDARRRYVDRFLEERPIQGIRLVENREHVEPPIDDQTLERDLVAGNELLDEKRRLGLTHDGSEPVLCFHEALRVVGTHDAAGC